MKLSFTLCFVVAINISGCYSEPNEKKLLRYLFDPTRQDAHNILELPTKSRKEPVVVELAFNLIQLIDVDEKNQNTAMKMWLTMKWKDYHFHWDSDLFGGLKSINIPFENVWNPDILLYNSADDGYMNTYPTKIIVDNTTNMLIVPPVTFRVNCIMDLSSFPFDKQYCSLKFGSWTYKSEQLDIRMLCFKKNNQYAKENCSESGVVDLIYFKENNNFNIIDNTITSQDLQYFNDTYKTLIVNLGIQRKPLYYIFNFIIPCILLSIMTLVMFLMPPNSREKITLGMIILLSMTILLLLIAEKLPKTSTSIPLISKYFLCIMILCSLSIIFTVLVLNVHDKSNDLQSMPVWIKCLVDWLAKVLFMKQKKYSEQTNQECLSVPEGSSKEMTAIIKELMKFSKKVSDNELKDSIANEWIFAARVIDRFCFFVFSFFTIITTIIILTAYPSSPKILA